MKVLIFLLLACFASLEFVYQLTNADAFSSIMCSASHVDLKGVGDPGHDLNTGHGNSH